MTEDNKKREIDIDYNRIDFDNPQKAFEYLTKEAGVDSLKAASFCKKVAYNNAKYKDSTDKYKEYTSSNPEYANAIGLKTVIDSRINLNKAKQEGYFDENLDDDYVQQYNTVLEDLFKDGTSLSYYTYNNTDFDNIKRTLTDIPGVKFAEDNKGRHIVYLDPEHKERAMDLINACNNYRGNVFKRNGFANYDVQNNKFVKLPYFKNGPVLRDMMEDPQNFRVNRYLGYYNKLSKIINDHTEAGERTIITENYKYAGTDPRENTLRDMALNTFDTKALSILEKLIGLNEKYKSDLLDNGFDLSNVSNLEVYDPESNLYNSVDINTAERAQISRALNETRANGGKIDLDMVYNPYSGTIKPLLTFVHEQEYSDKKSSKKVKKQYTISGDFFINTAYQEEMNIPYFAAFSDVRRMKNLDNNLTIGFTMNNFESKNLQLRQNKDGEGYDLFIDGVRYRTKEPINVHQASSLRANYIEMLREADKTNKMYSGRTIHDDEMRVIEEGMAEFVDRTKNMFTEIFGEPLDIDYNNFVRSVMGF